MLIKKKLFGEKHAHLASTLGQIAEIFRKLGKLEDADECYLYAYKCSEESHPSSLIFARTKINMIPYYIQKGEAKALALIDEAKVLLTSLGAEEKLDFAICLDNEVGRRGT